MRLNPGEPCTNISSILSGKQDIIWHGVYGQQRSSRGQVLILNPTMLQLGKSGHKCRVLSHEGFDRQTDSQTDRQTGRQTTDH